MKTRFLAGLLTLAAVAVGCSSPSDSEEVVDSSEDKIVASLWGGWTPPIFTGQPTITGGSVADFSSPWDNGKHCATGFKPGTAAVGKRLKAEFPGKIRSLGGFNCRPINGNPEKMSMHGSGRALDVHVSLADGDAIADYIVRHAAMLGVERVIWRKTQWLAIGVASVFKPYLHGDPHTDHIHLEVNASAAESKEVCANILECLGTVVSGDADGE